MSRRDEAYRQQPGFDFEAPAKSLARMTDPEPSQEAAVMAAKSLSKNERIFLLALGDQTLTASEVGKAAVDRKLHKNADTIRKRACRLVRIGELKKCDKRLCTVVESHVLVTTYRKADQ